MSSSQITICPECGARCQASQASCQECSAALAAAGQQEESVLSLAMRLTIRVLAGLLSLMVVRFLIRRSSYSPLANPRAILIIAVTLIILICIYIPINKSEAIKRKPF